ncbi:4Fe-4S binding protein [Chloroflexota bacterium]
MPEILVVKEDICIGCGICACFCAAEALEGWGTIKVNRERCTMCLSCLVACPVDALEVE